MEEASAVLKVGVEADITNLEAKMKAAENVVDKSGKNIGDSLEKSVGAVGEKLGRSIAKMLGAGFAIKNLDQSLRIIAEGIRTGQGANDIALAIGDSILDGLRRVPVAGALGDILAMVFDPLLGDPEKVKEAREKYIKAQQEARGRTQILGDIRMLGATPEQRITLREQADIEAVQKKLDAFLSTIEATGERKFDQAGYERAVQAQLERMVAGRSLDPRVLQSYETQARQMTEREPFFLAAGYTEEARREMAEATQAAEQAIKQIRERAEEERNRLVARSKPAEMAVEEAMAQTDEMAKPFEDGSAEIQELTESMETRGNDQSIFEMKLVNLAQDQLSALNKLIDIGNRLATSPGFN